MFLHIFGNVNHFNRFLWITKFQRWLDVFPCVSRLSVVGDQSRQNAQSATVDRSRPCYEKVVMERLFGLMCTGNPPCQENLKIKSAARLSVSRRNRLLGSSVAFVFLGHSITAHCDTLFSCVLEIFLLTYLLTYIVFRIMLFIDWFILSLTLEIYFIKSISFILFSIRMFIFYCYY